MQHLASVSAEELLRETRRLRRLARGLLFDRGRADDVVQEAWLAALRGGPADGRTLGAWLAGAARRLALNANRAEARVQRRERAAARGEASASTAESLSRIETVRSLVDAVGELDEPYRETIVLRFLDELPPREVARRQGVPVETVRTRTRRGLERLRARLDERHGGPRLGAFLGGLAPLAGKAPWRTTLGASTGSVSLVPWTGGLVMSKAVSLAAVSVAVALLATIGWSVWRAEAPPVAVAAADVDVEPGSSGDSAPEASDVSAVALERVGTVDERRTVASEPLAADWIVRGRATFGHGDPFAGAPLRGELIALDEDGNDGALLAVQDLVADEEGAFAWALPTPEVEVEVRVRIDLADHFIFEAEARAVRGAPAPARLRTHARPIDCRLVGRVLDPDGRPVAGAGLRNEQKTTAASDPSGRFDIAASSFDSPIRAWIRAPGFAEREIVASPLDPGTIDVGDVVLVHELSIAGRIVDALGHPVENARVSALLVPGAPSTKSNASGRFELGMLDPNARWLSIYVSHTDFTPSVKRVLEDGRPPEGELEIVLARGATVSGRVVDASGNPLAGAEACVALSLNFVGRVAGMIGADGRFELVHVPTGEQTLWITRAGKQLTRMPLDLREGETRSGLELVLAEGQPIEGRVVDEGGAPVPWAWVYVDSPTHTDDVSVEPTTSGADGSFRLEGLPDPPLTLGAVKHGFGRAEIPLREIGSDVVLHMRRSGRLAGRVVDGITGEPLQRFRIRFVAPALDPGEERIRSYSAQWSSGVLFTGTDGAWNTHGDGLLLDQWTGVEATADGYGPALAMRVRTEFDPDPDVLVLRLFPPSHVRGRVVGRDGLPVEGAKVTCLDVSEAGKRRATPYIVKSGDEGRFELAVPAGELALEVVLPGGGILSDGPFLLASGGEVERLVVAGSGARVVGELLRPDGTPIAGATVLLMALENTGGGHPSAERTTDENGAFVFEDQAPGRFYLSWRDERRGMRFLAMARVVELEPGASEARVELRMRGHATLAGTLRSAERVPELQMVSIVPFDPDAEPGSWAGRSYQALAEDGRFVLDGLEPGTYSVVTQVYDRATTSLVLHGSARVVVPATGTATVELELTPPKPR